LYESNKTEKKNKEKNDPTIAKLSSTINGKGFSEGEDTSSMIRISSTPDNRLLSE
jgi:hypothetical protein